MSENTKKKVKVVPIEENNLVNLIDEIVTEAVAVAKESWIAEQAAKEDKEKIALTERVTKLEKILSNATITKKVK